MTGNTFIAASQRGDGSWRKPRRVKEGFVPQEEVPLYESKGKKSTKESAGPTGLPPGITQEVWEQMKKQQKNPVVTAKAIKTTQPSQEPKKVLGENKTVGKKKKTSANNNNVGESVKKPASELSGDGWVTVQTKKSKKQLQNEAPAVQDIDSGVNGLSLTEGVTSAKKKKNKPKKSESNVATEVTKQSTVVKTTAVKQPTVAKPTAVKQPAVAKEPKPKKEQPKPATQVTKPVTAVTAAPKAEKKSVKPAATKPAEVAKSAAKPVKGLKLDPDTDPAKKLRNLKKRMKEIEELKAKQEAKANLSKDQLEKISRRREVKTAILALEKMLKQ